MSIVFYDTETTGLHTSFDQILQFAAIRTNPDLKELERFDIRCRLLPNIVPAPGAMRITGIRAAQLHDSALPSHYEMMCSIRRKMLEWSPCIFLGYNSIGFDEHLLRHEYYKTLHPPYLTNTFGNSRSDVMRAAQACSIFSPGALVIPLDTGQKQIFKLGSLAEANGFKHENAHEALADVEATIFISRLISEQCPDVWSSFMRFSTKAAVVDFASSEEIFCLADVYFGKPYSWLVTVLCASSDYSTALYAFDLGVDPDSLVSLNKVKLTACLSKSPKVVRRIRANAAPMIFSADEAPIYASGKNIPQKELDRRVRALEAGSELRMRIIEILEETTREESSSPHVEEQLYNGIFFSPSDQALLETFHAIDWSERVKVVNKFEDSRLRVLGHRLIHTERPDVLDSVSRLEHDRAVAKRISDAAPKDTWLTLPKALAEIEKLLVSGKSTERPFLMDHHKHLSDRLKSALAIL